MKPIEAVIRGQRYSTKTATLIASDVWWDGRNGRNTFLYRFLYRTPEGAYFVLRRSHWQGEGGTIERLTEAEAMEMDERMAAHDMAGLSFEEASPGQGVEDV